MQFIYRYNLKHVLYYLLSFDGFKVIIEKFYNEKFEYLANLLFYSKKPENVFYRI